MNTLTKIKLDRFLGKPVVISLNLAARCLGLILQIDHSLSKPPKTIAICKFMGMGNIIQSTPLLLTLRKSFPESKITFITRNSNHEIIELLPFIDNTLYINDRNLLSLFLSTHKIIFRLWKKRNDIFVDLETFSHYSTFISTLSLSRDRFSFYRREDHIRLGIYTHMMFFNNNAPISDVYLQMARFIGCKDLIPGLFHFNIDRTAKDFFHQRLINEFGLSLYDDLILVNPNSSNLRSERKWPADNFSSLVKELSIKYKNLKFGFIGSVDEKNYVKIIIDKVPSDCSGPIIDFSGRLNLTELAVLCDISKCMITNDSGPMHLSLAMGKPTVALFGPHASSISSRYNNLKAIYKNLYCSPCVHEFLKPPCKGDNRCMKQITVSEVKDIIVHLIDHGCFEKNISNKEMIYSFNDKILGIIRR